MLADALTSSSNMVFSGHLPVETNDRYAAGFTKTLVNAALFSPAMGWYVIPSPELKKTHSR